MTVPSDEIEKAVSVLRSGGVIAMPTDTLYALSARARDAAAVARVFRIKGREEGKPLLLFVSDLDMAREIGEFDEQSRRLAARFWPGPLTIVVRKCPEFESEALAGGDSVGLRVPDNAVARAVIAGAGQPLTGTSANLSGGADPASAAEVRHQIGDRIDFIIDAGETALGAASTIVDCTGSRPVILREGVIDEGQILHAIQD